MMASFEAALLVVAGEGAAGILLMNLYCLLDACLGLKGVVWTDWISSEDSWIRFGIEDVLCKAGVHGLANSDVGKQKSRDGVSSSGVSSSE